MNQPKQDFQKAYWEAKDALCSVIEQLQSEYQFSPEEAAFIVTQEIKALPYTQRKRFASISRWLAWARLRDQQIAEAQLKKKLEWDDEAEIAF